MKREENDKWSEGVRESESPEVWKTETIRFEEVDFGLLFSGSAVL